MPLRPFHREQAWLLPPSLEELLPVDHPARFVDAVLEGLSAQEWDGLGVRVDGDPMGAPSYHPRALLGVWLYGFMTGTRSTRKLEAACRDQLPYLWLTACQRPDHNTLWRFWQAHREQMRELLPLTVRTAVEMDLVDFAFQAVDGTKVSGNASRERSLDAGGLRRLLRRVDKTIDELEAQNGADNSPGAPRLPKELEGKHALRRKASEAMERVRGKGGWSRCNLTDPDTHLLKTRAGFTAGYNGQAVVSPVRYGPEGDTGPGGMLITAAGISSSPDDHPQLVPMIEQAARNTGVEAGVTLADAGYHSGPNLVACAEEGRRVLMPATQDGRRREPYHKEHFTYRPGSDSYLCPQGQTLTLRGMQPRPGKGYEARRYRAGGRVCSACPAFGVCTKSERGRALYVTPHEETLGRQRALMETEGARALYRLRKQTVEPVFGILKEQLGARRLLLRGLRNVAAEWSLLAVAFNLRTLYRAWKAGRPWRPGAAAAPAAA